MSFAVFTTSPSDNYVKIHLPVEAKPGNVSIKIGSGKVTIGDFRAENIQILYSSGNVDLYAITSDDLLLVLNNGNFSGRDLNTQNVAYDNNFGKGYFKSVHGEIYCRHRFGRFGVKRLQNREHRYNK